MNQKTFNEVKKALRKTIHTLIDIDFEDGKLDEAIKMMDFSSNFQIKGE